MFMRRVSLIMALMVLSLASTVTVAKSNSSNESQLSAPTENLLVQNSSRRRGRRGGRIIEELNLTSEQQEQLRGIRSQQREQLQALREQVRDSRQKMNEMIGGTATEEEIRAQHNKIRQLHQQIEEIRFESLLEMREVLTPQQRSQFTQLMEQRRQNFRQRRGDFWDED